MLAVDCVIWANVTIIEPVNLYGCELEEGCFVGPFVEIQNGCKVGKRSRISSHSFLAAGTQVGEDVFIGHGVMTCNDREPRAGNKDWPLEPVIIEDRASIGSGSILLPGIVIGVGALVGAGSVVTKDVPSAAVVAGNPARILRWR